MVFFALIWMLGLWDPTRGAPQWGLRAGFTHSFTQPRILTVLLLGARRGVRGDSTGGERQGPALLGVQPAQVAAAPHEHVLGVYRLL